MRRIGPFTGSTPLVVALVALALAGCASVSGEARQAEVSPVVPPTTPPAPEGVNPFAGARLYINPDYVKAVQGVEAAHANEAALLKRMESLPTAIWLSWIADTKDVPRILDDALQQQKTAGQPVVPLFVVYDLPNRDCSAKASAGELGASQGGEARYRTEFIDAIAAAFARAPQAAHRGHPRARLAAEPRDQPRAAEMRGGRGDLQARRSHMRSPSSRCRTSSSTSMRRTPAGSAGDGNRTGRRPVYKQV